MMPRIATAFSLTVVLMWTACTPEPPQPLPAEYDPTPYELEVGHFPPPVLPMDNPMTEAGVQLGRMLFHEKKLSGDNTQKSTTQKTPQPRTPIAPNHQ
jgi:cytochrome c peroxidase